MTNGRTGGHGMETGRVFDDTNVDLPVPRALCDNLAKHRHGCFVHACFLAFTCFLVFYFFILLRLYSLFVLVFNIFLLEFRLSKKIH